MITRQTVAGDDDDAKRQPEVKFWQLAWESRAPDGSGRIGEISPNIGENKQLQDKLWTWDGICKNSKIVKLIPLLFFG